jgi:hypothetical protein
MTTDLAAGRRPARIRTGLFLTLYCAAIFLALDFVYSTFIYHHGSRTLARIRNPVYDHGFVPNIGVVERWGQVDYRLYTNSLGFKDAKIRDVPAVSDIRRVVVIGDSFTEAIGLNFDDTFAGMLQQAGLGASPKTEFLNAGVSGYSATLYLRKIKSLIDSGVKFDEVLVALDAGEIPRESSQFFCFDDDPAYAKYCNTDSEAILPVPVTTTESFEARIKRHFIVTDTTRRLIKFTVENWWRTRIRKSDALSGVVESSIATAWPTKEREIDPQLPPLGVAGGIMRAQKHMQALADLLAAKGIALTVSVHPWPAQLSLDDRHSRAVDIWRPFCAKNCKALIDLFPTFFAYKDAHPADWYDRLFIHGDVHYSVEGNRVMYRELAKHLL